MFFVFYRLETKLSKLKRQLLTTGPGKSLKH